MFPPSHPRQIRLRRHRGLLVVLASFALLASAVAPTVSRLLAAHRGDPAFVEICSARGLIRVAFDPLGTAPVDGGVLGGEGHCGYCVLQQHMPTLPGAPAAWGAPRLPSDGAADFVSDTRRAGRSVRVGYAIRGPPPLGTP